MKKCLTMILFFVFCLGCLSSDDIDYIRLGIFSDAYRQENWSDAEYEAYYNWFHQLFGNVPDKGGSQIIHNMNEFQPYIQYGIVDEQSAHKVNFDKQVVLAVSEGTVAAKNIYIIKDYSSVISYTLVYDHDSPQCCGDNRPQTIAELKNMYVSLYAVDRIITEHEFMKSLDKCE